MGLGSLQRLSLAEARDERDRCNKLLRKHLDPIEERKRERTAAALKEHGIATFEEAASAYCVAHRAELGPKHARHWTQTLTQYAVPVLGKLSVADITAGDIVRTLEPLWPTRTGQVLRGRIEKVLGWAETRGYRAGKNPALWRGNLENLLANPSKAQKTKHHPALPFAALPALMTKLRAIEGAAARALEFTILTAARSAESIGATPGEIDYANEVWTVPGARMKGGKEHRVPLCRRAMELAGKGSAFFLFPGQHPERPINHHAMRLMMERLGYADFTVHGFRSTFRTWAAERTNYQNHIVEQCLAHSIGTAVERAYQRGDLIEQRRRLMNEWAAFCASTPTIAKDKNVVPLRSA
jgi:integrase